MLKKKNYLLLIYVAYKILFPPKNITNNVLITYHGCIILFYFYFYFLFFISTNVK